MCTYLCLVLLLLNLDVLVVRINVFADKLHQVSHKFAEIRRHLEGEFSWLQVRRRHHQLSILSALSLGSVWRVCIPQVLFQQLRDCCFFAIKIALFLLLLVLQRVTLQHERNLSLGLLQHAREKDNRFLKQLSVVSAVNQLGNLGHITLEVSQVFAVENALPQTADNILDLLCFGHEQLVAKHLA